MDCQSSECDSGGGIEWTNITENCYRHEKLHKKHKLFTQTKKKK